MVCVWGGWGGGGCVCMDHLYIMRGFCPLLVITLLVGRCSLAAQCNVYSVLAVVECRNIRALI